MKTISKIFFSLVAVLPFITSCKEEIVPVGGPENENSQGVYFSTLTTKEKEIELDPAAETTLSFPIFRTKEDGKISVPVKLTTIIDGEVSEASFFAAEAPEFEDGQTESEIVVTFPNTELGIPYTCNIECVDPDYVFTYSDKPTAISFTVTRVKWNRVLGPNGEQYGSWTDDIFSSMFNFSSLYAVNDKLEIFERDDKPGFFRIMDVYNPYMVSQFWGGAYPVEEFEENCTPGTVNYIDATDPTKVWLPAQTSGATVGGDGYIEFASCCEDAGFKGEKEYGTLVNGVIKFPVDGILVNFTVTGGWYTANSKGKTVIVLPGYKDTDYSLKLESGLTSNGKLPVRFTLGPDVKAAKYAAFEGVVDAADIHTKALEVFKDASAASLSASGIVNLQFEKTGKYTVIAVTTDDKDELKAEESIVVCYVASDDPVPVVAACGIGSAERYAPQGISTDTAVEFWIYGEDLTDVKMAAVKKIDLMSDMQNVLKAVSASKSVSSEVLGKINTTGYTGVMQKLLPGTEYYFLAYVSNGYEAEFILSETSQMTSGDPLPIYVEYTDDDYNEEFAPESQSDFVGKTFNYYATDLFGSLGMNEYVGKVSIKDSSVPDEGPDKYGFYDEYVEITGLSGAAYAQYAEYGFDDTTLFDLYGGYLYLAATTNVGGDLSAFTITPAGKAYNATYYTYFIPVLDGYYAYVTDADGASYGFKGIGYADAEGFYSAYINMILVDPAKDDNGLAPAQSAKLNRQISDKIQILGNLEASRKHIQRNFSGKKSPRIYTVISNVCGKNNCPAASFTVSEGTEFNAGNCGRNVSVKKNLVKSAF